MRMEAGSMGRGDRLAELRVGQSASLTRTVSADDIAAFAEVTGDTNPVHLDDSFARTTRFGGRIAHGMLTASLISAVLGTQLPGPGAIYVSQTLNFRRPVRPGDTITATVEVREIDVERRRVRLSTVCVNGQGEAVLTGDAVMLVDP